MTQRAERILIDAATNGLLLQLIILRKLRRITHLLEAGGGITRDQIREASGIITGETKALEDAAQGKPQE